MESKKWVASVLVVLVGSPFAVAALDAIGISPFWQVEAPEWEAGYSWTFSSSFEGEIQESGAWMDEGSVRFTELGESHRTVVNTTAKHGDVSLYAVVEQFVVEMIVEDDEIRFKAEGDEGLITGRSQQFYTQADLNPFSQWGMVADQQELRLLDFPLRHGASWTVFRTESQWGPGEPVIEELRARVAGKDVVHLPGVGSMDAVRIEVTITRESLDSIQRAVGVGAEVEGPTPVSGMAMDVGMKVDLDLDYRLTYWYAPEAKSIVRTDMLRTEEMRMSFAGETLRVSSSYQAQEILSDYSLEAGPERSMQEIERLWSHLDDLPGVTQLSNETWPFSIAASHYSVDTIKGETATLGIVAPQQAERTTLEFDELPDGMKLLWRHRSLDEGLAAHQEWYTGPSLELSPQWQGLHEVTAYLLDEEDRLVGLDSTMIEGYARWEQEATFIVGALLFSPEFEVPFHANVFMDHVRAQVDMETIGTGMLSLEGVYSDGSEEHHGEVVTGSDSIVHDSLDPYLTSSWTAKFTEQVRVGQLVLTVEVRYDRSASFEHSQWMWDAVPQAPPPLRSEGMECSLLLVTCSTPWGSQWRFEHERTPVGPGPSVRLD